MPRSSGSTKVPSSRHPISLDIEQGGFEAGLPRGILQIGQRAGILGVFGRSREMKVGSLAELFPRLDQPFVDRIELIGMARNDLPFDRLLEPGPLEHRRLEDRGRRIRVVFEEFRRTASVEAEIEPAIEAALVAVPAFGDQRPDRLRYLQPAQPEFVVDRAPHQFEAHRVDFAGRRLDLPFDLLERERIVGAFVPIALAVDGVKIESGWLGGGAPVVAFRAGDALHPAAASRHHAQWPWPCPLNRSGAPPKPP